VEGAATARSPSRCWRSAGAAGDDGGGVHVRPTSDHGFTYHFDDASRRGHRLRRPAHLRSPDSVFVRAL
jgi:hypothetical protein